MSVQCVACKNFSLRGNCRSSIGMASQGYGICSFGTVGQFQSAIFPRHCAKFAKVDAEIEAKRVQWLDKQKAEFLKRIEKWN